MFILERLYFEDKIMDVPKFVKWLGGLYLSEIKFDLQI